MTTDPVQAAARGRCADVRGAGGFTLIELMITVVIVAILASVAYPSYTAYVARGHRTQLKTQMVAAQQWMERYFSEHYAYGTSTANSASNAAFENQGFAQSPPAGEGDAKYTLAVAVDVGGQGYRITATRAGSMTGDECGDPSVTNTGVKSAANFSSSKYGTDVAAVVASCWR